MTRIFQNKKKEKRHKTDGKIQMWQQTRGRQYWREEGQRTCRICEKEEDIKHVLRECNMTKEDIREEE